MHARIGSFEVAPQGLIAAVAFFREKAVAAFCEHPRFLGYQLYMDRERGRFVGISLWSTRPALDASVETARRVLAEAAAFGATTLGEPQVLELAFDLRSP